ncbi:branched chain amino acid/phenylalanine ABC transporter ATP binding subunit LivF [Rhodovastum atsumiense]|uniref:ABC transporter ATP-binding protein n=1 Tax=Rhodovastum atsumiense TaxID=504468 RepID=A0A5M6IPX6_9PROT|nr:ABC transporter ATP-binding protein [Rhodovastum atsumiense]KAA5610332.1 ABC transporter ATP-binding protein [Rhodovastum atsumiense]CAH2600929.1 branched chain amino acid/phenylalanine ABC transporter ATP binding subunit LivF [Rhodovastum atsumiense]
MSALLAAEAVSVSYGRVEAVRGVSVALAPGQIATVIGPNGAGKSSLLGALMGLVPCRGRVVFAGEEIGRLGVEDRVGRGIALVPERRELFATMTVEENLLLGAWAVRLGGRALRLRRDEVFGRFPRLAERRGQRAGTLSGGERQMLALGRALMGRPRLLMLDEPSLGLAPLIVREIFHMIRGLRETGVAILLVEQNARAALESAEHAYVLETGEVGFAGPAAALLHDPRVVATYLGGAEEQDGGTRPLR